MKSILKYSLFSLLIGLLAGACNKDDKFKSAPVITIDDQYKNIEGLNAGEQLSIKVNVRSDLGIKRLAYYFITKTSNGNSSGTPVFIDRTDAPAVLDETITFAVAENFLELVIIAFDVKHGNSEVHIKTDNIRAVQQIQFKDDISHRESVFEGKRLKVEGKVVSAYDLSSITYQTILDGAATPEQVVSFTDKREAPFSLTVDVSKRLSGIIINTLNVHKAIVKDTFTIGSVQDDAVVISLENNQTSIARMYTTVNNEVKGNIFSGSDMTSLAYSIKKSGVYGPEVSIPLGSTPDEFPFTFGFVGQNDIEAVKIRGVNAGGKTNETEYVVDKVYKPLKEFKNVVLTTEIGPGKINFFSAYKAPHFFSIENAAPNDEMIDLGFFKYTATSNNIMPPGVFNAGPAYATALAPYLVGFDKAAYTLVTANRPSVNNTSFDTLKWDTQLLDHVANKVAAPTSQGGEGYNIYTTNRRTNNVFNIGQGFYIGWGRWDPIQNQSFGIVIVRGYTTSGQYATVTLDIKVPEEDQRTKFNPVSLFNYP